MAAVVEYARALGWAVYHPYLSVRSTAGFPDLTMTRGGRLVFAELKVGRGRLTEAQRTWLAALGAVPGVEAYCWWCTDAWWAEIERVLR